jgi:hypothetical protein
MASNLALDALSVGFLAMSADTASEFIKRGFASLNRQVEGIGGADVNNRAILVKVSFGFVLANPALAESVAR